MARANEFEGRHLPPCAMNRVAASRTFLLGLRTNERGIECRFGKSPLLPSEPAQVHVAIFVEDQCRERASYNAGWLAADELDNQAGHTHALPSQNREGMLTWILQHPDKSRVCKAVEATILSDEKST